MNKLFSIFFLTLITGCSTLVGTNELLVQDEIKTPVDIQRIKETSWFDRSKHSISTVSIKHKDNIQTNGLHLSVKDSDYVVVYFGGNSFRIQDAGMGLSRRFSELGVDFLWVDYRGIGASEGSPSIENLKQDAIDTYKFAQSLNKKIILHGTSMGSFIANTLASEVNLNGGLVLEAAIVDVDSLINGMTPFWYKPFNNVVLTNELSSLSNEKIIANYSGPLFLIVGDEDEITPVSFTNILFSKSPSKRKTMKVVKGAMHVNSMTFDQTIEAYAKFIDNQAL